VVALAALEEASVEALVLVGVLLSGPVVASVVVLEAVEGLPGAMVALRVVPTMPALAQQLLLILSPILQLLARREMRLFMSATYVTSVRSFSTPLTSTLAALVDE
jgi:hypothetical protein